jgi:hypothetical protein
LNRCEEEGSGQVSSTTVLKNAFTTGNWNTPNIAAKWLPILLRIREVLGSHFGRRLAVLTEDFVDYPHSLQAKVEIVP